MSFDIHASGLLGAASGGGRTPFRYSKYNCFDKSDFEPPALLAMIPSAPTSKAVAEKIGGTQEEYLAGSVIDGMTKVAETELAGMVKVGIERLSWHTGHGEISVYCVQEDWLWGTTNSYVNFKFYGSYDPGKDFLKKISPGLVKTGLNNFGVLSQIAAALSQYNSSLPGDVSPYLNISLSH
jgi:hypothetical protein